MNEDWANVIRGSVDGLVEQAKTVCVPVVHVPDGVASFGTGVEVGTAFTVDLGLDKLVLVTAGHVLPHAEDNPGRVGLLPIEGGGWSSIRWLGEDQVRIGGAYTVADGADRLDIGVAFIDHKSVEDLGARPLSVAELATVTPGLGTVGLVLGFPKMGYEVRGEVLYPQRSAVQLEWGGAEAIGRANNTQASSAEPYRAGVHVVAPWPVESSRDGDGQPLHLPAGMSGSPLWASVEEQVGQIYRVRNGVIGVQTSCLGDPPKLLVGQVIAISLGLICQIRPEARAVVEKAGLRPTLVYVDDSVSPARVTLRPMGPDPNTGALSR